VCVVYVIRKFVGMKYKKENHKFMFRKMLLKERNLKKACTLLLILGRSTFSKGRINVVNLVVLHSTL
jgi:hypothetical protein